MRKALCTVPLLLLLLLLASCALLKPIESSKPESTAPPVGPGSLTALRTLLAEASPSAVSCTVTYDDPAIGLPLAAETRLSFDGSVGSLSYRYDRLNPIGSDGFTSTVSGEASGDLATLSAALSGSAAWVWDATVGISLPSIRLEHAYLATAEITASGTEYLLRATPTAGNTGALLGLALADATDVVLQIRFTDDAVSLVQLCYGLGSATYTVTASFTYSD